MSTATKSKIEILSVVVTRVVSKHDGTPVTSASYSLYEASYQDGESDQSGPVGAYPSTRTITVKQFTGPVERGQRWCVAGRQEIDQRWLEKSGRTTKQFVAQFATLDVPRTYRELDAMLSSGLVDGWDMHSSSRVLGKFGTESSTLETCLRPESLESTGVVTQPMIDNLREALDRAQHLTTTYAQLAEWGVTGKLSDKLVKHLGFNTIGRLEKDPYHLVLEIDGYGWKSAEGIGTAQGIAPDDPRRVAAGTAVAIHEGTWQTGHTWLTEHEACFAAVKLLGCASYIVHDELDQCYANETVVLDSGRLYPGPLHRAEQTIAAQVAMRLSTPFIWYGDEEHLVRQPDALDDAQWGAVCMAMTNRLSLLTGGPGVGKTTTLKTLVQVARDQGLAVTCMAPTGKAAARMTEATGWPATTIHSRLKIVPNVMDLSGDLEPVSGLVIVDEVSMLDTTLAAQLLTRLSPSAQLLLVGDPDQLPSVGPGAVLRDLIAGNCISRVHLDKVYRNDAGIAVNAARIRAGQSIVEMADVELIPTVTAAQTKEYLTALLISTLTKSEVLLLTPTNDKPTGRHALNQLLQPLLNTAEPGSGITQYLASTTDPDGTVNKRSEELRLGDRVMVQKNDSDLGVFNGQVGTVVAVPTNKQLVVRIDDRDVWFKGEQTRLLTLAYAITGHKSQGSEAPVVIVVVERTRVLGREWAYTCMTRARERCYFIGDMEALQGCLAIQRAAERRTGLVARVAALQAAEWVGVGVEQ